MQEPLDELYLKWLYSHIGSVRVRNPTRTYWSLARLLFLKEFVWFIPNDDNRVEDGRSLRRQFLDEEGIYLEDPEWIRMGCSMLEMLIGLARRLEFLTDGPVDKWFWKMLENIGIDKENDRIFSHEDVEEAIDAVIWRTYDASGQGGLFPLRWPEHDQTEVELWYQLNAFVIELEQF